MKLRYVGGTPAVDLELPGGKWATVQRNHQVEVPDDLGRNLLEQDVWQEVEQRTPQGSNEGGDANDAPPDGQEGTDSSDDDTDEESASEDAEGGE